MSGNPYEPRALIRDRASQSRCRSFLLLHRYSGSIDCLRKVVRQEGAAALYKGFGPSLVGVAGSQLYITAYEAVKDAARAAGVVSEPIRNLIGGAAASLVQQSIAVPVDVVSQQLMVQGQGAASSQRPSSWRHARGIVASQGVLGLYRGYTASLLTLVPSSSLFWAAYGVLRRGQLALAGGTEPSALRSAVDQGVAAAAAGSIAGLSTNPLDIVRARLQVLGSAAAGGGNKATMWSTLVHLVREDGAAGLLKGVTARCGHMASNSAILILCYEQVKILALRRDRYGGDL